MDTCSTMGVFVSEDISHSRDLKRLDSDSSECEDGTKDGVLLKDLGDGLNEQLHIQEGYGLAQSSDKDASFTEDIGVDDEKVEDEELEDLTTENLKQSEYASLKHAQNSHKDASDVDGDNEEKEGEEEREDLTADNLKLSGYVSLEPAQTLHGKCEKEDDDDDEEEEDEFTAEVLRQSGYGSVRQAQPRPILLPPSSDLVSAMKGSREKLGTMLEKLVVTWAPDVYEPPPSASTIVRHKQPHSKSDSKKIDPKKKGLNKEKGGKSSKTGKDKRGCWKSKYQSPNDDDDSFPWCKEGSFSCS